MDGTHRGKREQTGPLHAEEREDAVEILPTGEGVGNVSAGQRLREEEQRRGGGKGEERPLGGGHVELPRGRFRQFGDRLDPYGFKPNHDERGQEQDDCHGHGRPK